MGSQAVSGLWKQLTYPYLADYLFLEFLQSCFLFIDKEKLFFYASETSQKCSEQEEFQSISTYISFWEGRAYLFMLFSGRVEAVLLFFAVNLYYLAVQVPIKKIKTLQVCIYFLIKFIIKIIIIIICMYVCVCMYLG
ncbi:transmembrane protein, putative (macronuclear) [Tetrahymena thermophila SB210]|uniref:Transmembrane protein, putative n=1 Tax=Tetrahymena thermophila (strain SB210) TaxID=312017 RepID=W7XEP5_TETTS|nr:transmembrane protein, putative [Tetrahymena thermophila SB210]EWS76227.1 transmembrane protein, putative [Tetrahymena thermophila SB210]|eukprot:XP_012651274.1 transmembrane protein, putative [Tetrahymena thermophila SB210]